MLELRGHLPPGPVRLTWSLPPSKSLWARRLLLDTLEGSRAPLPSGEVIPEDILALSEALGAFEAGATRIDVRESGTAMRLMLAFLAAKADRTIHLVGQGRQHKRPIAPLVDSLRELGASIEYLEAEGFPPLAIHSSPLTGISARLDASASSQYLSALFLLAPFLSEATVIDSRQYPLASRPYAEMTLALLAQHGYRWREEETGYFIYEGRRSASPRPASSVEGDWSAASYAYALLALLPEGSSVEIPTLQLPSLQGDAEALRSFFLQLGIATEAEGGGVRLVKHASPNLERMVCSMKDSPDLVPAVVVALVGQGIPFKLTRVAHLRLKESDRLLALQLELAKLGYPLTIGPDSLSWEGKRDAPKPSPVLHTHGDHRIAMALSLLALVCGPLTLDAPEVVGKSFPNYWQTLLATSLFSSHQS